ncbi:hypothetical protein C8J57DRAFT_1655345 [Mycena rebaudengoi]|nr:hypothetical protein C8J57DRAFT_1655345 [Mycena rebaudengoi]
MGFSDGKYLATCKITGSVWTTEIQSTQSGVISTIYWMDTVENSIVLYSTIPIVDSTGNNGSGVALILPMNTSVSSIQIFHCLQSLVNQTAIVDVQMRQAVTLEPELKKTSSTWRPYTGPPTTSDNLYIDGWAGWYTSMPQSAFPLDEDTVVYLIQKLNLHPTNNASQVPRTVKLHDVENALSELVASMFWTLGHIPPTHEIIQSFHRFRAGGNGFNISIGEIQSPVFLVPGEATVTQHSVQAQLDSSIIAVSTHAILSSCAELT